MKQSTTPKNSAAAVVESYKKNKKARRIKLKTSVFQSKWV